MEKHLKLFANKGKFNDNNNYITVDNDTLTICIDNEFGGNTNIYAIIKNGSMQHKFKVTGKKFTINSDYLVVGELDITIIVICGNIEIGRYFCVPIIIRELDDKKIAIDEIELIKQELDKDKQEYEALKTQVQNELLLVKQALKGFIGG